MNRYSPAVGFATALLVSSPSAIAVPAAIPYVGQLITDGGAPFSGAVEVTVALFPSEASDGTDAVWGPYTLTNQAVFSGILSFVLGGTNTGPLDSAVLASPALWLEVGIDSTTLAPRQAILAVPYARLAADSVHLGGTPAATYVTESELAAAIGSSGGGAATSVTVAASPPVACSAQAVGAMYFDSTDSTLKLCNGSIYGPVGSAIGAIGTEINPATSCAAILANQPAAQSGTFWIDPDGLGTTTLPFLGYCDMSTDDGGWMLVMSIAGDALPFEYLISGSSFGSNFTGPQYTFRLKWSSWGNFDELRFRCLASSGGIGDAKVTITPTAYSSLAAAQDLTVAVGSPILFGAITRLPANTVYTSDWTAYFRQYPSEVSIEPMWASWGGWWAPQQSAPNSECNQGNNANDHSGDGFSMWVR